MKNNAPTSIVCCAKGIFAHTFDLLSKKCCIDEPQTIPGTHLAHCVLSNICIHMNAGQHVG